MLFKKLDWKMKWVEAFLCLRISHFLSFQTTFCYMGNIPRKLTEEDWLHTPPRQQVPDKFQLLGQIRDVFICACISSKNIAMPKKRETL